MIWRSVKALDLRRDPRLTVHSLPPGKDNSEGDLKLYGHAVELSDRDDKVRYEDAIEARINWRPAEPYHVFAVDIDRAGFVVFGGDGRESWSWRAGGRLRKEVRPNV
jgi:hypothetical protein